MSPCAPQLRLLHPSGRLPIQPWPPALSASPGCADDGKLEQVVRDSARVATEQVKGLSTQVGVRAGGRAVFLGGVDKRCCED